MYRNGGLDGTELEAITQARSRARLDGSFREELGYASDHQRSSSGKEDTIVEMRRSAQMSQ